MRRKLVMAGVALRRRHDIARQRNRAAVRHEIVHARRMGIRLVGLLNRDARRHSRLVAQVERIAVCVRAWRRAAGLGDIGGESVRITAISVVDQRAKSVAGGRTLLAALHRTSVGPIDVVLPIRRAAIRSRLQLGDVKTQIGGGKTRHADAGLVGNGEIHHRCAVDSYPGDRRVQFRRRGQCRRPRRRRARGSRRLRAAAARAPATTSGQRECQHARRHDQTQPCTSMPSKVFSPPAAKIPEEDKLGPPMI